MTSTHNDNRWYKMYCEISSKFGYDIQADTASAQTLERILQDADVADAYHDLHSMIAGNTAFVIGAGPSLAGAFETLAKHSDKAIIIAADTTVKHLLKRGIIPHVIVSDLDGHIQSHIIASKQGAIIAVHAHADNTRMLHHASKFNACMGTTQTKPFGRMYNLGGFTDGDRAIFLADHFGASRIILFGMDFGDEIGAYSDTAHTDHATKMRKMQMGKKLVERWIVKESKARLLVAVAKAESNSTIQGFDKITYKQIMLE